MISELMPEAYERCVNTGAERAPSPRDPARWQFGVGRRVLGRIAPLDDMLSSATRTGQTGRQLATTSTSMREPRSSARSIWVTIRSSGSTPSSSRTSNQMSQCSVYPLKPSPDLPVKHQQRPCGQTVRFPTTPVYRVMSMAHDEPGAGAVVADRCDDQSLTFSAGAACR